MTGDELRGLLVDVDSVCSLIAYRFPSHLPPDVIDDLKALSFRARCASREVPDE